MTLVINVVETIIWSAKKIQVMTLVINEVETKEHIFSAVEKIQR